MHNCLISYKYFELCNFKSHLLSMSNIQQCNIKYRKLVADFYYKSLKTNTTTFINDLIYESYKINIIF